MSTPAHTSVDQKLANSNAKSVNVLGEVVASFQGSCDLGTVHGGILGHVLGVLPLKELDAIFGVWDTSEVAVCGSLLVLWFPQSQGDCNGTRSAIELNLEDVGDVISSELAAFRSISLHPC